MAGSEGLTDGRNVMEDESGEEEGVPRVPSGPGDSSPPEEKEEEDAAAAENGKRRRNRRKHKGGRHHRGRKWKPYSKMTWDEKKSLEERETRRACMKREERFASGQAMAPYNTTQFLMDQHDSMDASQLEEGLGVEGGDPPAPRAPRVSGEGGSGSVESSDEYYDSPNDEEIFLQKDFTEAYENYHAERLQSLTKDELIKEHLELEAKIERMEKRTKEKEKKNNNDPQLELTKSLEAEIKRLKEENVGLVTENCALKGISKDGKTEC